MKYSQDKDEFFSKIKGQKDHGEHTKSKLAKLLTTHGTSWIGGQETGENYGMNSCQTGQTRIYVTNTLLHNNNLSCYIIDFTLYVTTFVQMQSSCQRQPAFW